MGIPKRPGRQLVFSCASTTRRLAATTAVLQAIFERPARTGPAAFRRVKGASHDSAVSTPPSATPVQLVWTVNESCERDQAPDFPPLRFLQPAASGGRPEREAYGCNRDLADKTRSPRYEQQGALGALFQSSGASSTLDGTLGRTGIAQSVRDLDEAYCKEPNRLVRTRMLGGVGGPRSNPGPYPDALFVQISWFHHGELIVILTWA